MSPSSSSATNNGNTNVTTTTTKTTIDPVQFIATRRHATRPHTDAELAAWIAAYTRHEIPEYQMAAWLMAVCLQGLSEAETATLTRCMVESGQRLSWSLPRPSPTTGILVDKHSTGGVGDKVSLILAPLAACMGVKVPMIAGRGLGHSGGTIDKLEAIAGFDTSLDFDRFQQIVQDVGCCIIAAGPTLCPADKKLYALRDVTSTVQSLPLQTASIMSKKVAENPHSLVLDTKYGKGAFQSTVVDAELLARSMIATGQANGLNPTTAFLTRMDEPIGTAVGNWLEVEECLRIMRGNLLHESNARSYDLITLVCMQVGQMVLQSGVAMGRSEDNVDLHQLATRAYEMLDSGAVLTKFRQMVVAQGGDPEFCDDPNGRHVGKRVAIAAPRAGYIADINGLTVGLVAVELGAGRRVATDVVDFVPGIIMEKKVGSFVNQNETLAWVVTGKVDKDVTERLLGAFEIVDEKVPLRPIVTHRVSHEKETEPISLPPVLQKLYDNSAV